jgi:hypothetical protein
MNHARPQTRQIRERDQAGGRPQLRLIRVREQSVFANSPRQQARRQSVCSRGKGAVSTVRNSAATTHTDTPLSDRDSGLAAATATPLTGIGRDSEPAMRYPRHRIAVAISPLIRFPVHIRVQSTNVLI